MKDAFGQPVAKGDFILYAYNNSSGIHYRRGEVHHIGNERGHTVAYIRWFGEEELSTRARGVRGKNLVWVRY